MAKVECELCERIFVQDPDNKLFKLSAYDPKTRRYRTVVMCDDCREAVTDTVYNILADALERREKEEYGYL